MPVQLYGHTTGVRHPANNGSPWGGVVVNGEERETIYGGVTLVNESADEVVEHRLRQLGYV